MASGRDNEVICFLCDYGLYILVLLFIAIALFWAQVAPVIGLTGASIPSNPPVSSNPVAPVQHPPNLPEISETPIHLPVTTPTLEHSKASATAVITVLATEQSDSATPEVTTKTPIISPTPTLNSPTEYVIAFIPLHWSGTREDFLNTAQRTGDFFVQASGIDRFFSVHYLFFEEGYSEGSLSDEDLLTNMMTYAIQQKAADRYIGITDGDLAPGGRTWVAGYTFGWMSRVLWLKQARIPSWHMSWATLTAYVMNITFKPGKNRMLNWQMAALTPILSIVRRILV